MAELIYNGKSLKMYCTPKCGISNFRYMVKNGIFNKNFRLDKEYKAIVIRNVWDRLVSFYVQKIVISKTFTNTRKIYKSYNNQKIEDLGDKSFKYFINILNNVNIYSTECHISPQSIGVEDVHFDLIINLANINDEIKPLLKMVKNESFEISHVNDSSSNNWLKNIGGQVKNYENINHTRDVVVEGAYDMTPDELIKVGIPNNYNYFYNEELIEMVGNIFKKDIDRFNLEYPYKK